ncbi:MAG: hypothetical protein DKM50_09620 [Candidatus Margulisiibacteriota bacterium]|nr:MAG: hypothetical protein A2X43_10090 [Candidatus Margulisbacteria bacterium GWD2_39_127]OGI01435.1 MAG: hypothetical protein A2X42_06725 [Candidatus Margulisbacteria bacterium GWF2_38_17]OGI10072.1 MAG: hypothetical protein A2X41_10355 [Candidatus Margulisbacteria bacterium GWE2_39_32]PZM78964.1 MAG: hypothetical protein DKM50_09620 [Candidatus Margulisiibacteriota bacterium]HAR64403.1 hypothetical protein [Candidatus Margulisiibacteriota bacterium]
MKIVHLITSFQLGGAEKVAIDLSLKLKDLNHECIIVAVMKNHTAFGQTLKSTLKKNNISFHELGVNNYFLSIISVPLQLLSLLRKLSPDIVHSHTEFPDFILASTLRLNKLMGDKKISVVRTIHNTVLWPKRKLFARVTEKMFVNDGIIFVSKGAQKAYSDLRNKLSLSISKNAALIYNGIDVKAIEKYDNHTSTEDIGIILDSNYVNFCFAGRLIEQKGFDVLVKAVKQLPAKYLKKIRLYVFGAGKLISLQHYIKAHNLPIIIHDPVNDVHKYFSHFDYIIMPSRFEGLGMVSIESLGAGVPLLASNAEGLVEALPADWPLIVQNESAYDLTAMIRNVIDGLYDREMLAKMGKQFIKSNFDLNKSVKQYEKFYSQYLKMRS